MPNGDIVAIYDDRLRNLTAEAARKAKAYVNNLLGEGIETKFMGNDWTDDGRAYTKLVMSVYGDELVSTIYIPQLDHRKDFNRANVVDTPKDHLSG